MARQLTFDLPVRPALEREDFFVSPANELALATLDAPGNWPDGKMLLIGPEGAGKSHLARVWAAAEAARIVAADAVAGLDLPDDDALVVEDADRIAGDRRAEIALFHVHNHLLARGARLLVTARNAPGRWGLTLPDLKSRMEATATATLLAPDDALLSAVLIKLFADRQLAVSPRVIQWILPRMDRSFAALHRLVADLDAAALAHGGPVTQRIAAEVLDSANRDTQ